MLAKRLRMSMMPPFQPAVLGLAYGPGVITPIGPTASWSRTYAGYLYDVTQSIVAGVSNTPRTSYAYIQSSSIWAPGILLEGQSINIINGGKSDDLSAAGGWTVSGPTVTSNYTSSDSRSFSRIQTSVGTTNIYSNTITPGSTQTYAYSYFVKGNGVSSSCEPGAYDETCGHGCIGIILEVHADGTVVNGGIPTGGTQNPCIT